MAISFIPNQPILFDDPLFAGQSCLNNDTRAYAQLLQAGDTMCIQWKNEPKTTEYACSLNNYTDIVINGDFATDLSNWDEYNFLTGTNLGAPTNWIWSTNGATSDPTLSKIGLLQTLTGTLGDTFLISFEFEYDNGGDFYFYIGDQTTNFWDGSNLYNNFETNIDGRRCLLIKPTYGLDFAFYCDTSSVTVKNIIVRNVTAEACVKFSKTFDINSHWTYVESVNGWQKIDGTAPSLYPLSLTAYLNNGENYKMSYKIMNMIENSSAYFEIIDVDNNSISKSYINGEFVEYFTDASTGGYPYLEASSDAYLGIIYDIKFETMCYDQRVSITYQDGSCASVWYDSGSATNYLQYYQDRIVWCFDMSTLESCDVPGGSLTSGCYTVTIDDGICGGGTYQSYTTINYTTATHPCSVVVRGSCQGYGFGFYFNAPGTSVSFALYQRLRLLQFNPYYKTKTEQYNYSNGTWTRTYAESGKIREAWFDYVDEPTHDVIRVQLLCENLIIDNKLFFCVAEDYEPEWGQNGKYNLAQSKVALLAQDEPTLFNKSCI